MTKIKSFLKTTIIGGIIVALPIAIMVYLVEWIVDSATNMIQPLTDLLTDNWQLPEYVAAIIIAFGIILILFVLRTFVRTRFGGWIQRTVENRILKAAPGYSAIRETVVQLLGTERKPFSTVVLAQIFGNETLATAFVTDTHPNGSYSIFVPTGPNPMSGNIYHLKARYVHPVDVPVEKAMRSIISCGAGSKKMIEAHQANQQSQS